MPLLSHPPGSVEPVAVADARVACRIDGSELDAELAGLISAAREQAEHITGRYWRLQVQRLEPADWPAGRELLLDLPSASAVAISYRSAATPEDWTALASDQIRWGALGHQTSIRLRAAVAAWPELADATEWPDRLRVDVTVGPADVASVPASVQRYILASVAGWMDSPASLADGRMQPNPLFERLLDAERVYLPCA